MKIRFISFSLIMMMFSFSILYGCSAKMQVQTEPLAAEHDSSETENVISASESISSTSESLSSTSESIILASQDSQTASAQKDAIKVQEEPSSIILGFAGDFNLDENWSTTQYLDTCDNGITDCISSNIIEKTNSYDLFMLNNEFTYSNRGTPLAGKAYTFRANPERVDVIKELGTDLVLLANNHVYDYGEEAFLDTLDVLSANQIPYVGAGRNIEEASTPLYYTFDNLTIAYVAATRAEKNIMTPEAGVSSPGVLRTYDETAYLDVIKTAHENADYVIASVHWGTEYSNNVEEYQRSLARKYIDAGADAVIGSHPHVLQGMEFYQGKPIMYSLGNFWFNEKELYSCLIELQLNRADASLEAVRFIPCIQKNYQTTWPTNNPALLQEIISFEQNISYDIHIDKDGTVIPTE